MDESGDEADHDNRNQTLEIQSPVEVAGGEDSLDEEVDEAEMESRKSDRIVSNECEEDDKVEKQKDAVAAEGGSCSEQSSLLLEYQLSIDNHSESRVIVTESHNRSASLVNNTSKTVEITMAARGSRRFTQHGSQFLDVEDRVKSLHNFGTSFDGFDNVLNVSSTSGKKSLGPVEGENSRISPVKATPESDSNNTSLPSQNNSVNKNGKRSSASKELFCDRTSSSNKDTSGNNSKQNLNDSIGVLDASMQPLDVEEGEMNRSLRRGEDSANRSSKKENIVTNYSKQTNKSRENLLNDSVASNRSLRSRTRGESNKSVIDDESKTNEESRDVLLLGVINESPKEANEVRGINRSLRNRTGNSSNNMSETEGSKENSKSGNDIHDSQKEERGNSRSLRNESRGNKNKSITEKESSDVSMDVVNESQQGVGELENSKRSLRNKSGRREEDGSKENEKKGEVSINVSKQGLDEADGVERSLRDTSAVKRLLNKSVTEDRKERRRESSNKSSTEEASSKENNVQEEADEERGSNRSLRNRSVAKGKSNRNVSGDQNSKQNFDDSFNSVHDSVGFVSNARTRRTSMVASKDDIGESSPDENAGNISHSLRSSVGTNRSRSKNNSRLVERVSPGAGSAEVGDGSPETVSGGRDAINGVTYSSEEIVGQKRGTSLLYNSLDTFSEEHRSSVSMLQIPHNRNESAMINNSLDSTVNATRHDPIPSDEVMPAPRSLPARKRRLANVDTPSFSSLTQKKKKTVVGETDSIVGLVEKQNDQVAVNNNREVMVTKVDYKCPKLKKPEPWATKRLYDWIIQRLEPRYKLRSRLRAEEFVVFLCSTVKTVIKKKENYEKDIEDLKYEMARLNLIENKFQFFSFIYKFLPWQFEDKSLPLPQSFITHTGPLVTFEKGTLYDPIL
ncbi:hypothetical protein LSTR_LSTR001747 [Laodelphax striatellus]|uniref:Uncharacterized protein n=1 Tax=Laodelphax striatellus TaxID=195883 RepID=A0A482XCK4_LAOST|nr:hypothetical protein LSTR_LSTR001747 [Laodelphax striatellus]